MTMSACKVLYWVDEFKNNWLPKHIPNDDDLIGLIINKINELEHILTPENTPDVNESADFDKCQHGPEDTSHQEDVPVPTVLSNHTDEDIENQELFSRPAIRIKRIPLAEAELYMPDEWKPVKPRRGRRRGRKKSSAIIAKGATMRKSPRQIKTPLASTQDTSANEVTIAVRKSGRVRKIKKFESSSSLISIPSTQSDQQKSRRKLRAIIGEDDDLLTLGNLSQGEQADGDLDCEQVPRFIGQNGILSQTRKLNETTTLSTVDDDFTIKSQSQKTIVNETIVNYSSNDPSTHPTLPDASIAEPMNILGDLTADEREQMYEEIIETDDNESVLTSLNRTNESHAMTNNNNNSLLDYRCCIEDISNDGMDPPPSSSSPSSAHIPLTT